jgi:hypothetical protein
MGNSSFKNWVKNSFVPDKNKSIKCFLMHIENEGKRSCTLQIAIYSEKGAYFKVSATFVLQIMSL